MSIAQSNSIDFIGTDNAAGSVVLTISDHLDWGQEDQHLLLLQAKLNTYIAFVESGEIKDMYPAAQGKEIRIEIVAQYPLSDNASSFLRKVQPAVEEAGFRLSWRLLEAKTGSESNSM